MAKTLRRHIPTIIAVLLTVVILIGSFVWFSRNTDEMVESTTEFYLEMNARSQAAAFHTKLENQLELLRAMTHQWKSVNMSDPDEIARMVSRMDLLEGFQRIAVAGRDAQLIDTTGKNLGNVSGTVYFKRAMEGKSSISDIILNDREMGEYLYVAVPILQEGVPVGIMYGQFHISVLSNLIESVGFQETSTSILVSGDGTILARSATNELVTDRIMNFYDLGSAWGIDGKTSLNDIKVDIMNKKTVTVPYRTGSRERLAILTPVGINNWYYAIVISQDLIHRQSNTLSYNLIFVEAMITMAFICLFLTILQIMHHTVLIEKTNDRFKMANLQTHAIVFDYDFRKQQLEVNGSIQFLVPDAKETYSGKELEAKAKKLLHENDRSVMRDFMELSGSETSALQKEMRVLCVDGNYYWYRFTGTVIRSETGELIRLVGNFMNVEDEVSKNEQLKQKAEIDPLSGLLNKGAFTSYVTNLLEESDESENLYAFYIIDLDNFKKVNDTLGHIVGDHVISDVAKKLCTVFSENDYVGRIGGDEFTAFLKLSGEGIQMGQRIIRSKAAAACAIINEIYSDGKKEVNITASIGVSIYPKDGKSFEELYKNADRVLYQSKNGGKNRYTICS